MHRAISEVLKLAANHSKTPVDVIQLLNLPMVGAVFTHNTTTW